MIYVSIFMFLLVLFFVYALCSVASDADDWADECDVDAFIGLNKRSVKKSGNKVYLRR